MVIQTKLYRLTEHFLRKANLPVIRRTAETELAVADAVNIERVVADRSNSKLVYVNLCSQELLHRSDGSKSSRALDSGSDSSKSSRVIASDPLTPAESNDRSEPTTTYELSTDPEIEAALRTAGLLSDSPPNSPHQQAKDLNDEDDPSKDNREEGPDNVFEMDSHLELDIYGDFEYDLEDEDYIGATALKASNVQEEGESKMKVVFSTLKSDPSDDPNLEEYVKARIAEVPKNSPSLLEQHTDVISIRSSTMGSGTYNSCPPESFLGEGGKEPSVEECEELYGPDKEPLIQRFPEKTTEALARNINPGKDENHGEDQAVKGGENSSHPFQTGENGQKEKSNDTNKQTDSIGSVHGKVLEDPFLIITQFPDHSFLYGTNTFVDQS